MPKKQPKTKQPLRAKQRTKAARPSTQPTQQPQTRAKINRQDGSATDNKNKGQVTKNTNLDSGKLQETASTKNTVIYITNTVQYAAKAALLLEAIPFRMPNTKA